MLCSRSWFHSCSRLEQWAHNSKEQNTELRVERSREREQTVFENVRMISQRVRHRLPREWRRALAPFSSLAGADQPGKHTKQSNAKFSEVASCWIYLWQSLRRSGSTRKAKFKFQNIFCNVLILNFYWLNGDHVEIVLLDLTKLLMLTRFHPGISTMQNEGVTVYGQV